MKKKKNLDEQQSQRNSQKAACNWNSQCELQIQSRLTCYAITKFTKLNISREISPIKSSLQLRVPMFSNLEENQYLRLLKTKQGTIFLFMARTSHKWVEMWTVLVKRFLVFPQHICSIVLIYCSIKNIYSLLA